MSHSPLLDYLGISFSTWWILVELREVELVLVTPIKVVYLIMKFTMTSFEYFHELSMWSTHRVLKYVNLHLWYNYINYQQGGEGLHSSEHFLVKSIWSVYIINLNLRTPCPLVFHLFIFIKWCCLIQILLLQTSHLTDLFRLRYPSSI